jgi:nucleoside-diphosphate-sugar epimerase
MSAARSEHPDHPHIIVSRVAARRPYRTPSANDYQRTKARAHAVAREAAETGLPVISLVPGVVYGPGPASEGNLIGRLIRDHLAGTLPGVIGAARRWSFAYIDDVAEAHVRAITSGQVGQTYPSEERTRRRCEFSKSCGSAQDGRCRAEFHTRRHGRGR